jgi:hypothetical protein
MDQEYVKVGRHSGAGAAALPQGSYTLDRVSCLLLTTELYKINKEHKRFIRNEAEN